MAEPGEIIIVGAGIGGLCAALGLARAGLPVRVVEAAPELGEVGAGLTLGSNATHALNWLGLGAYLAAAANKPGIGAVRHFETGEVLVSVRQQTSAVEAYGAEYYQIHRADLHAELVRRCQQQYGIPILLDRRAVAVGADADRAWITLESGARIEGAVVIGCDGLRSAIRHALFDVPPASFTGQVAWRGMVPAEAVPAEAMVPESSVYVGPGKIFTRYFLRGRSLINFVCIGNNRDWHEESWTAQAPVSALLDRELAGWHADVRAIVAAQPGGMVNAWALFDRDPLPAWGRGRITLLGDAAHPILPFLGQGAAMAIEDAVVLTRALAGADGDPAAALRRYEAARMPRASALLQQSREQGRRYQETDPAAYSMQRHQLSLSAEMFTYRADQVAV